jgi:hypothetical protein
MSPFPVQSFRIIHTIDISLPLEEKSSLIGITIIDFTSDRVRSVLISVEGLVLFDGMSHHGIIKVFRAVAPLDTNTFAQNLFADVRFLFMPHKENLMEIGRYKEGQLVCRWRNEKKEVIETVIGNAGGWTLTQYNSDLSKRKEAKVLPPSSNGFSKIMVMKIYGALAYSFRFELVEAEFMQSSDSLFEP